eukprot:GHVQ01038084.1.p1 GENE.GHVQ01038084.1~~GHVQ01038084.1.p1  ORF type:complete len:120 (-),score=25.15 GHVQ01038084.1:568-927(-)
METQSIRQPIRQLTPTEDSQTQTTDGTISCANIDESAFSHDRRTSATSTVTAALQEERGGLLVGGKGKDGKGEGVGVMGVQDVRSSEGYSGRTLLLRVCGQRRVKYGIWWRNRRVGGPA